MIDKVRFKNFKILKDVTLVFSPGINYIYGSSDTGKTTSLKGLLWALLNRAQGKSPITHGEKEGYVETFLDGHTIERGISDRNYYKLDGDRLTAFRNTVPEQISDLVKMSDINIQNRRDLPFMIGEKAGEAAERFSTMLDLNEIGESLANVASEVNAIKTKEDTDTLTLKSLRAEYDNLAWVEKSLVEVTAIEAIYTSIEQQNASLTSLNAVLAKFMTEYNKCKALHPAVKALTELNNVLAMVSEITSDTENLKRIESTCNRHQATEAKVESLKHIPEALGSLDRIISTATESVQLSNKQINLEHLLGNFLFANKRVESLKAVPDAVAKLESIVEIVTATSKQSITLAQMASMASKVQTLTQTQDEAHERLQALQTAFMDAMPDVCPLCGTVKEVHQ